MKMTVRDWRLIRDYAAMYHLTPQLSLPSIGQYFFTTPGGGSHRASLADMRAKVAAQKAKDKQS